jgi:hypothetical protein
LKLLALILPYNATVWLVPFLTIPSCVPGGAVDNSVPPGEVALNSNARLLTPDTSVRVVAEYREGDVVTSLVQFTQKLLPVFVDMSPVLVKAMTEPNESVAAEATVHVGTAHACAYADAESKANTRQARNLCPRALVTPRLADRLATLATLLIYQVRTSMALFVVCRRWLAMAVH